MTCGLPDRRPRQLVRGCDSRARRTATSVPVAIGRCDPAGRLPTRSPAFFLNSYAPLVIRRAGILAAEKFQLKPFIDGSIRREPDLEHPWPSISCLCRAGKFAPRLRVGDIVAYVTKKDRYTEIKPHQRLTSILRVHKLFDTHLDAAQWYSARKFPLPSNCMVDENPPQPLEKSHHAHPNRGSNPADLARAWDRSYCARASDFPRFVVCQLLWQDLEWTAPRLCSADLEAVFGRIPGTRNPGALPMSMLDRLVAHLGIRLAQ